PGGQRDLVPGSLHRRAPRSADGGTGCLRPGGSASGLKDRQPQRVAERQPGSPSAEHPLLTEPRRAAVATIALSVLTVTLFLLVADQAVFHEIQKVDDAYLRTMVQVRNSPFTDVAKVLDVLGLIYVTLPVRIA